jgi:hypothetical protein
MSKRSSINNLDDLDLLNWIFEQELPWREGVYKLSNANTLKELVDFVRNNYQTIKQLENEKARIN